MIWYLLTFAAGQATVLVIQWMLLKGAKPPKHMYEPSDY